MIHPDTEIEFINPEVGYGLVAKKLIPKGTITWVLDKLDREFTPQELENMEPIYQSLIDTYTFRNNKGNFILCWDHGKYINHSFNSNCLTTAYDFEIAIRDIQPGEQLTDDYGYLNISSPFRGIDEGTRRKVVYPNDILKYYKVWDSKVKQALKKIAKVEQPLKVILSSNTWNILEAINNKEIEMESVLSTFYDDSAALSKK